MFVDPGAYPGFEREGGVVGTGARISYLAYLGQFMGLLKEFVAKTGGHAPPAPPPLPSESAPGTGNHACCPQANVLPYIQSTNWRHKS